MPSTQVSYAEEDVTSASIAALATGNITIPIASLFIGFLTVRIYEIVADSALTNFDLYLYETSAYNSVDQWLKVTGINAHWGPTVFGGGQGMQYKDRTVAVTAQAKFYFRAVNQQTSGAGTVRVRVRYRPYYWM